MNMPLDEVSIQLPGSDAPRSSTWNQRPVFGSCARGQARDVLLQQFVQARVARVGRRQLLEDVHHGHDEPAHAAAPDDRRPAGLRVGPGRVPVLVPRVIEQAGLRVQAVLARRASTGTPPCRSRTPHRRRGGRSSRGTAGPCRCRRSTFRSGTGSCARSRRRRSSGCGRRPRARSSPPPCTSGRRCARSRNSTSMPGWM